MWPSSTAVFVADIRAGAGLAREAIRTIDKLIRTTQPPFLCGGVTEAVPVAVLLSVATTLPFGALLELVRSNEKNAIAIHALVCDLTVAWLYGSPLCKDLLPIVAELAAAVYEQDMLKGAPSSFLMVLSSGGELPVLPTQFYQPLLSPSILCARRESIFAPVYNRTLAARPFTPCGRALVGPLLLPDQSAYLLVHETSITPSPAGLLAAVWYDVAHLAVPIFDVGCALRLVTTEGEWAAIHPNDLLHQPIRTALFIGFAVPGEPNTVLLPGLIFGGTPVLVLVTDVNRHKRVVELCLVLQPGERLSASAVLAIVLDAKARSLTAAELCLSRLLFEPNLVDPVTGLYIGWRGRWDPSFNDMTVMITGLAAEAAGRLKLPIESHAEIVTAVETDLKAGLYLLVHSAAAAAYSGGLGVNMRYYFGDGWKLHTPAIADGCMFPSVPNPDSVRRQGIRASALLQVARQVLKLNVI